MNISPFTGPEISSKEKISAQLSGRAQVKEIAQVDGCSCNRQGPATDCNCNGYADFFFSQFNSQFCSAKVPGCSCRKWCLSDEECLNQTMPGSR
mmetsp:Transcript_5410/g.9359  ORF Transcript_5410/g.9359 Transcript_5410/m.9359 type:complete len:94 (+) Transcript_5410:751-1032(+)